MQTIYVAIGEDYSPEIVSTDASIVAKHVVDDYNGRYNEQGEEVTSEEVARLLRAGETVRLSDEPGAEWTTKITPTVLRKSKRRSKPKVSKTASKTRVRSTNDTLRNFTPVDPDKL